MLSRHSYKDSTKLTYVISSILSASFLMLSGCQTTSHSTTPPQKVIVIQQPSVAPSVVVVEQQPQHPTAHGGYETPSADADQSPRHPNHPRHPAVYNPDYSHSKPQAYQKPATTEPTPSYSPSVSDSPSGSNTAPYKNYPYNQPTPSTPSKPSQADDIIVVPSTKPDPELTQKILLERAKLNSKQHSQSTQSLDNGSAIPAFRRLMDTGVEQLRQGQVSAAQSTFTRAQRLAPQSSAVYFYLGQVALKQNQLLKAEAMARRGLTVARLPERKKALWQLILKTAQQQGNARVIKEAQTALSL